MSSKMVCDGCGNVKDEVVTHAGWAVLSSDMAHEGRSRPLEQDLCQKCAKSVREFIKSILVNQR